MIGGGDVAQIAPEEKKRRNQQHHQDAQHPINVVERQHHRLPLHEPVKHHDALFLTRGYGYYQEYHDQGDLSNASYAAYGLSPVVIGQELRGRNAFTGVTITDALEAGALNSFGTTGQRAVSAAGAGMDLILCSARDVSQGEAATAALASALGNGQLDPAAFNAAVNRVTALRAGLF